MPGGRRGLVAPQNTFLENIIRRYNSLRKWLTSLLLICVLSCRPFIAKTKPLFAFLLSNQLNSGSDRIKFCAKQSLTEF